MALSIISMPIRSALPAETETITDLYGVSFGLTLPESGCVRSLHPLYTSSLLFPKHLRMNIRKTRPGNPDRAFHEQGVVCNNSKILLHSSTYFKKGGFSSAEAEYKAALLSYVCRVYLIHDSECGPFPDPFA